MTNDTEAFDRVPTYGDLEALFVNNRDLDEIEAYLSRFNPIRVMRMERKEIRHSAILAWLLDPAETHGLGDRFLKAFLCEALRGDGDTRPTALDISRWDLRDTQVRLEWQNIDIFLHSDRNDAAFIIENKLDSRQHGGQLARYMEKVRSTYDTDSSGLAVRGIFLTLWDEVPEDESYATVGYEVICDILPRFIAQESSVLTAEVETFLKHYLEILKDVTGMSEDLDQMQKLARQLYRTHKKVLDFVVEHGAVSDFAIAVRSMVDGDDDLDGTDVTVGDAEYRINWTHNDSVCFLPKAWHSALHWEGYSWPGCEKWWAGYPVISWIDMVTGDDGIKGKLVVYSEVGPLENHDFRRELIEAIKSAGDGIGSKRIAFQSTAANKGKKYSKFLKDNTVAVKDVQDAEEIAEGIRKLLKRFQPEFEAISEILPEFEDYAEAVE